MQLFNHRLILQQNALLDLDDSDDNSAMSYLKGIIQTCIDEVNITV